MPYTQYATGTVYFTVEKTDGPVDLTGAQVFFIMKKSSGDIEKIQCSIVEALEGKCMVNLSQSNLSEHGTYQFQLRIMNTDNTVNITRENTFFVEQSIPDPDMVL